jgi:hypothetical protein
MRRKLSLVLTLTAWLLATGSHWDLVQTFAYARMFADNARTLSLEAAVTRTFSPEGRCEICTAVDTAKQSPDHANAPASAEKFAGKILLTHEPEAFFLFDLPPVSAWFDSAPRLTSAERSAPPLPPPRA